MTVEKLAGRLHMAFEGLKKKPGLMRSGVGDLQLVADYIDAVADAPKNGKLAVIHGTQMPTEIFCAMDMVPVFNELNSVVLTMMGAPPAPRTLRPVRRKRTADRHLRVQPVDGWTFTGRCRSQGRPGRLARVFLRQHAALPAEFS